MAEASRQLQQQQEVAEAHTQQQQQEAAAAADPDILGQEMLRKYIAFAKDFCNPKLANADYDKISQASIACPAQAPL